MKKMISVAFVAALLATGVGVKVNAAGTDRSLKTQAEFNVQNGDLILNTAPHLNFGNITVSDLVNKKTPSLALSSFAKSDGSDTVGNTDGNVNISNYDVNVKSWKLSAQATDFKNGSSTLEGAKLNIGFNKDSIHDITTNSAVLLDNSNASLGDTNSVINTDSKVDLTSVSADGLKSGKYFSDITWTLSNTTPTQSASSFK